MTLKFLFVAGAFLFLLLSQAVLLRRMNGTLAEISKIAEERQPPNADGLIDRPLPDREE